LIRRDDRLITFGLPLWKPPFGPSVSLGVVNLPFDELSSSLSDLGVEDRVVSKGEPSNHRLKTGKVSATRVFLLSALIAPETRSVSLPFRLHDLSFNRLTDFVHFLSRFSKPLTRRRAMERLIAFLAIFVVSLIFCCSATTAENRPVLSLKETFDLYVKSIQSSDLEGLFSSSSSPPTES
jgi:hypothetical protein